MGSLTAALRDLIRNRAGLRRTTALRIAVVYAAFAFVWIFFSDRALQALVTGPETLTWLQTVKGWVFVITTAVILYVLIDRGIRAVEAVRARQAEVDTRRQRAERALSETERMLTTLRSNLPGMAYRCRNDPSWTMESVSEGCEELTGYASEDLVENSQVAFAELIHPEDRAAVRARVDKALGEKAPFQLTYRIRTADGTEKWVWEQGRGVFGDSGRVLGLEGVITDITERKELEAQLFRSQKLESIGRMAGGIAHDFNNVLTAITGFAKLISMDLDESDPQQEDLQEIQKAVDRARSLTGQLLVFARQREGEPRVLDLNETVRGMEEMLRRLLGANIEIELALEPELGWIKADPGKIEQVLMNLVVNARDAMGDQGRLTIETTNADLDAAYVAEHEGAREGPHISLGVSDTGTGMDEETQERIFEPFFTTKGAEKGTGLGLSTVYGIVKDSGGNIWVYSEAGEGTTFRIYLPRVDEAGVPLEPIALPSAAGGTETILLIDDERSLQVLISETLEAAGYDVIVAPDGATAVELVQDRSAPIELILSDIVLPDGRGPEFVDRVKAAHPGARVLYISGMGDVTSPGHGAQLLRKPFTRRALLGKVRHLLDAPLSRSS